MVDTDVRVDVDVGNLQALNDLEDRLRRVEQAAEDAAEQVGDSAERGGSAGLGGRISRLGLGYAAAGAAGLAFARDTLEAADRIDQLRNISGLSAESLQTYATIVRESGGDMEDVADIAREMQLRLAEAASLGTGPAVDALNLLNLSIADFEGLSPDEQFLLLRDAISEVEHPAHRLFVQEELLGGATERTNALFAEQSDLFRATAASAAELNRFTNDSLERFDVLERQVSQFADTVKQKATEALAGFFEILGLLPDVEKDNEQQIAALGVEISQLQVALARVEDTSSRLYREEFAEAERKIREKIQALSEERDALILAALAEERAAEAAGAVGEAALLAKGPVDGLTDSFRALESAAIAVRTAVGSGLGINPSPGGGDLFFLNDLYANIYGTQQDAESLYTPPATGGSRGGGRTVADPLLAEGRGIIESFRRTRELFEAEFQEFTEGDVRDHYQNLIDELSGLITDDMSDATRMAVEDWIDDVDHTMQVESLRLQRTAEEDFAAAMETFVQESERAADRIRQLEIQAAGEARTREDRLFQLGLISEQEYRRILGGRVQAEGVLSDIGFASQLRLNRFAEEDRADAEAAAEAAAAAANAASRDVTGRRAGGSAPATRSQFRDLYLNVQVEGSVREENNLANTIVRVVNRGLRTGAVVA